MQDWLRTKIILNENVIRNHKYQPGDIVYFKHVYIKAISDNSTDGKWVLDKNENGHPFVILSNNIATPEELFGFIISHFDGKDLDQFKNDYNEIIKPHKTNKLEFNSLVQCFYVCDLNKAELANDKVHRKVTPQALEHYESLLNKFINDFPNIDIIKESIERTKSNLFNLNYIVDGVEMSLSVIDDWETVIRGEFNINYNDGTEPYYFVYVYDYETNLVEFQQITSERIQLQLTDNSDVFDVIFSDDENENHLVYLSEGMIYLLNEYDDFVRQNNVVDYEIKD